MDDFAESQMCSLPIRGMDTYFQVVTTMPDVWEDWPFSLRTSSTPTEVSEE